MQGRSEYPQLNSLAISRSVGSPWVGLLQKIWVCQCSQHSDSCWRGIAWSRVIWKTWNPLFCWQRKAIRFIFFSHTFCILNTCFHFHSYSSHLDRTRPPQKRSSCLLPHFHHISRLVWVCSSGHWVVQPFQRLCLAFFAREDLLLLANCARADCQM